VFRLSSRKRLRGRARRGGLGGAGRALGALGVDARRARRARQVCKEITSKKRIRIFHALHRHAGSWVQATRGERRYAERREKREGKREGKSRRRRIEADENDETGDGWRCRRVNKARVGRPRGDMKGRCESGRDGAVRRSRELGRGRPPADLARGQTVGGRRL